MVAEAQDVPAHDFGQLLDCVNLMLRHLQRQAAARHCKRPCLTKTKLCPPQTGANCLIPETGGSPVALVPGATE